MLRKRFLTTTVIVLVAVALLTGATLQQAPEGGDMGLPSSSSSTSHATAAGPVETLGDPFQTGFEVVTELSGLDAPTAGEVQFGWPDLRRREGGEDQGVRLTRRRHANDNPAPPGTTPTYDYLDRGFLGLALDPNFPAEPWVYGLHTRVHDGYTYSDTCPAPIAEVAWLTDASSVSKSPRPTRLFPAPRRRSSPATGVAIHQPLDRDDRFRPQR